MGMRFPVKAIRKQAGDGIMLADVAPHGTYLLTLACKAYTVLGSESPDPHSSEQSNVFVSIVNEQCIYYDPSRPAGLLDPNPSIFNPSQLLHSYSAFP
jgi:hypothetical protein